MARSVLTDFPVTASMTAAARATFQRQAPPWLTTAAKELEAEGAQARAFRPVAVEAS